MQRPRHLLGAQQVLLDLELGGDASVIAAGEPQGAQAPHARMARHQVFHGDEHGVAQVQLAGDVGRRHRDHEGRPCRVPARLEIALRLPPGVALGLDGFEVVGLGEFEDVGQESLLQCAGRATLMSFRGAASGASAVVEQALPVRALVIPTCTWQLRCQRRCKCRLAPQGSE